MNLKLLKSFVHEKIGPLFKARSIFIALTVLLLSFNVVQTSRECGKMHRIRKKKPYTFLGLKFSGLKDILKETTAIGYITDKDMDDNLNALQFSQAQYILAPIILELNSTAHKYLLFDFSEENLAAEKIKELGVIPARRNQFGIVLAVNPQESENP